jgi:hypothetical protein
MKEQDLFEFLKSSLYPDLERSPGIYDAFDCFSVAAGHYIELKCRYTHYDTLLIEVDNAGSRAKSYPVLHKLDTERCLFF